ncbi:MAG: hypothetical protein MUO58_15945 [Anaerolineales bacterium]|nr:hypothetical protein [Anaerolineales bacterium]
MSGNQAFDGVSAERTTANAGKDWVIRLPIELAKPRRHNLCCFWAKWRAPLLSAFPFTSHMGARSQDYIIAAKTDQLRDPESCLDCSQEKSSVPSSDPGSLIRCIKKSIDLFRRKELDGSSLKAFAWDGENLTTEIGACWLTKRDITEE